MNTYKVRVEERNGRKYNAVVNADVGYEERGCLVFSTAEKRVAVFAPGSWVYYKLIVEERK